MKILQYLFYVGDTARGLSMELLIAVWLSICSMWLFIFILYMRKFKTWALCQPNSSVTEAGGTDWRPLPQWLRPFHVELQDCVWFSLIIAKGQISFFWYSSEMMCVTLVFACISKLLWRGHLFIVFAQWFDENELPISSFPSRIFLCWPSDHLLRERVGVTPQLSRSGPMIEIQSC